MSDVVTPKTDEELQAEQAAQTLAAIQQLRKSIPFDLYFLAEPRRRIAELEDTLKARAKQRKPMDESERQFILGQISVLERWRDKLDQDEAGSKSILTA